MSRLVLLLGILLILVGAAGMVLGVIGVPAQFMNTISQAINPKAEDLCKPGEKLVEETGAASYSPTVGYRHDVAYFCVNGAGVRRDVTGDFVQGIFDNILPSLGGFAIPILSGGLCSIGFVLALIGFIFSRRRAVPSLQYTFEGQSPAPAVNVARQRNPTGDVAAKLRQLDDARQSGLITEDEYQRTRQQILDSIK